MFWDNVVGGAYICQCCGRVALAHFADDGKKFSEIFGNGVYDSETCDPYYAEEAHKQIKFNNYYFKHDLNISRLYDFSELYCLDCLTDLYSYSGNLLPNKIGEDNKDILYGEVLISHDDNIISEYLHYMNFERNILSDGIKAIAELTLERLNDKLFFLSQEMNSKSF